MIFSFFLLLILIQYSLPDTWHAETIVSEGMSGGYSSLAIDSEDNPHIAFCIFENSIANLYYAWKEDDIWHYVPVDTIGDVGRFCSLTLDTDDNPHIAYRERFDELSGHLKYAVLQNDEWIIQTIDDGNNTGRWCDIALDSNDFAHVSHGGMRMLKYTCWDGVQWKTETLFSPLFLGCETAIVLDSQDHPHISCYNWNIYEWYLAWVHWNGSVWEMEIVEDRIGEVGRSNDIVVDAFDHPHISYSHESEAYWCLKYATRDSLDWELCTIDSSGFMGRYGNSIDFGSDGRIGIAYYEYNGAYDGNLFYASCENDEWQVELVDSLSNSGKYASLSFNSLNTPCIAYHLEYPEYDLRFAFRLETGIEEVTQPEMPGVTILPNPFSLQTSITVGSSSSRIPEACIFNMSGRVVKHLGLGKPMGDEFVEFRWNGLDELGRTVPSGVYMVRIESGSVSECGLLLFLN